LGVGLWSLEMTLRVHLIAAPIIAFVATTPHKQLAPEFDPPASAAIIIIVMLLDALVVAPLFERLRPVPKRNRDLAAVRRDFRRPLGCRCLISARPGRLR
jgi:hypothetical protein